ncbi:hypothetical protein C6341_g1146 [Phytophthora cactorum]|nr:hypothetical protein PC120_g23084 [Phytophthora cactorum]KAG3191607.1 hypothetical protein C6341_g1146 [Phytophthora cactorum]
MIKRAGSIEKVIYKLAQLQAMHWSKEIWAELQDERSKEPSVSSYEGSIGIEDIIIRSSRISM